MIACNQCSTSNSVDSLFCKNCGAAIASDARTDAQEKLQELISEGYRIFNEGRTEEARLVAETALADEPNSTSALSLKGMCHERAGEIAEALAVYERVVEMNPDSALDKIKVTHLRQMLAGRVMAEPPARSSRALIGAAAAVVLVVAVGIAIGASSPPDSKVAMKDAKVESPTGDTASFGELKLDTAPGETKAPAPDSGEPPVRVNPPDGRTPTDNPATRTTPPRTPFRLPDFNGTRLPMATGEIGGERPVVPPAPEGLTLKPQEGPGVGATAGSDTGPDPKIDMKVGGADEPKKPAFDPGVIEIKVSRPPVTPGGGQPIPDSNGTEALLKAARQQFLLGRHSQAATTYEAALRSGADPATTNQRIAQCYANMGNNAQAAAAYRRAISSFEASLNGPGDKTKIQSALEACKRALKTLGG